MFHGSPFKTYETPKESRNFAKKLMRETSTTTMTELVNLSAEQLKEASQKLMSESFAPTLDGKLIPADVYAAYKAGLALGIEFIIGIHGNETQIYKSSVGNEKYGQFMSETLAYILHYLDAVSPEKANLVEQFYALMTYYCAKKLAESGNKVHLLYWGVKPLIEKLGSGTVDVAAAFLGNREAA